MIMRKPLPARVLLVGLLARRTARMASASRPDMTTELRQVSNGLGRRRPLPATTIAVDAGTGYAEPVNADTSGHGSTLADGAECGAGATNENIK
jgi:hypothetical protein